MRSSGAKPGVPSSRHPASALKKPCSQYAVAIVPCRGLKNSEAFCGRVGFRVVSDDGHYLLLAEGKSWHLHLTAANWPGRIEDIPSASTSTQTMWTLSRTGK